MNNAQESLLDIVNVIYKWRKTIIMTTVGVAILSVIIVLLLPNFYNSSALLYPANLQIASRGALFGNADETLDIFGKSSDLNRIMMVAESDEIVEYLNIRYNFYERYDIDSTHAKAFYYVKLNFLKHYNVRKNEKDALEISIEDKNPKDSYEMLWSTIGKIDELVRRMTKRNEEIIMESYRKRIDAKQQLYSVATDSLNRTREKYGIVDVETQRELLTETITMAESNLAKYRGKLQAMQGISRRDSINKVKTIISSLEAQVNSLKGNGDKTTTSIDKFNQGRETVLLMETAQEFISEELLFLKDRYFQLETVYNTNIAAVYVLDAPDIPIIKSRPKRTFIVLSAAFFTFILSVLGVLLIENYKSVDWNRAIKDT